MASPSVPFTIDPPSPEGKTSSNPDWANYLVKQAMNQATRPMQEQLAQLTATLQTMQAAMMNLAPFAGSTPGVQTPLSNRPSKPPAEETPSTAHQGAVKLKLLPDPPKFTGKRKDYDV